MRADVAGVGSNAAPNAVTTAVTQNTGIFVNNIVGWSGNNWESNASLATRCTLALAQASPDGPSQSYVYFAETAQQILAAQMPPYNLTNGAVTAVEYADTVNGIVETVVASSAPVSTVLSANVTPGCAQLYVIEVWNTNPCIVWCIGNTSLSAGQSMTVTINGVLGTAGVNGTFLCTYNTATSFRIPVNTVGAGVYTGGGVVEGGDLGQIDNLLQQNVTPDNVTSIAVSARALPLNIAATVLVPQAYVATYEVAVQIQLAAQISSYPIGGRPLSSPPYSVGWDDILGAIEEAGILALGQASYVRGVQSLSVSGNSFSATASGQGITFPSYNYQAILSSAVINVIGV